MPNETLPSATFRTLFDDNWNTDGGLTPEPIIIDINNAEEPFRANLTFGDHIFISADSPALEERPIGTWVYGHRTTRIIVHIYTIHSRQRLYNLMGEIRRICHNQMHSLTEYQRIQFMSFMELVQEEMNVWRGRVIIEAVNNAVLLETTV